MAPLPSERAVEALLSRLSHAVVPSTPTIPLGLLAPRQQSTNTASAPATTVTVVSSDSGAATSNNSVTPGAIAGIVIGSVAGILLLLWIFRSCGNLGAPPKQREAWYDDVNAPRHRHHHHSHHHGSSPRRSRSASHYSTADYAPRRSTEVRTYQPATTAYVTQTPVPPAYVYDPDKRSGRGRSSRRASRS